MHSITESEVKAQRIYVCHHRGGALRLRGCQTKGQQQSSTQSQLSNCHWHFAQKTSIRANKVNKCCGNLVILSVS